MLDVSIPFGSEAFSTQALAAKSAGVNAMTAEMDVNSNIALLTALKQNGVNPKVVDFATGYSDSLINSTSWSTLQGVLFEFSFRPWSVPDTAGTIAQKAAFKKYEHFTSSQFPDFAEEESYLGADLMIQGISSSRLEPDAGNGDQVLAGHDGLQRRRDPPVRPWTTPPTSDTTSSRVLRLDADGQDERLRPQVGDTCLLPLHPGGELAHPTGGQLT